MGVAGSNPVGSTIFKGAGGNSPSVELPSAAHTWSDLPPPHLIGVIRYQDLRSRKIKHMAHKQAFFEQGEITVTNMSFIVGAPVFAMRRITLVTGEQ